MIYNKIDVSQIIDVSQDEPTRNMMKHDETQLI